VVWRKNNKHCNKWCRLDDLVIAIASLVVKSVNTTQCVHQLKIKGEIKVVPNMMN